MKFSKKYLPEFVYGSIDGTVTTFAIVAGVVGASLSHTTILILGFANVFADGFSMAASDYLAEESRNKQTTLNAFKKALVTFFSFVSVGIIPLLPYIFLLTLTSNQMFFVSCIITSFSFIVIGFIRGKISGKNRLRASLETFLVGGSAATIAYVVGYLLKNLN
jgi:VIT1/CCC1 family predicted Fe2+/Mn2+ transporter